MIETQQIFLNPWIHSNIKWKIITLEYDRTNLLPWKLINKGRESSIYSALFIWIIVQGNPVVDEENCLFLKVFYPGTPRRFGWLSNLCSSFQLMSSSQAQFKPSVRLCSVLGVLSLSSPTLLSLSFSNYISKLKKIKIITIRIQSISEKIIVIKHHHFTVFSKWRSEHQQVLS